jgi:DNA polymerase-1
MQAQTRSLGSSVVVPVVSSSSSSSSATQAPTLASLEQLSPYATAARLFRPLANMHRAGMRVCVDTATARRRELLARMQALETAATAAAQTPFLITSPEQVSHVLYTVLKLPRLANTTHGMAGQRRTTGAGQKFHSTSSEHLLRLSSLHAVPGLILQHRQAHKLVSTYVDPLLRAARVCGGAPCLHPRWHHTCTATGRMSSSHPNLQSMPKKTISLELASLSSPSPARCPSLRCMLVPAPGRTFLAADYRQVEVRMAAVLSGDAGLRAALAGGGDVYTGIAAQCFSILASEVSSELC